MILRKAQIIRSASDERAPQFPVKLSDVNVGESEPVRRQTGVRPAIRISDGVRPSFPKVSIAASC